MKPVERRKMKPFSGRAMERSSRTGGDAWVGAAYLLGMRVKEATKS